MKLSVLTENTAGDGFLAEHGLSYLIEINNEKILFDAGSSDVFLQNAEKLGINIQKDVDRVVLSHGHWDHGNGLQYLKNKTLITHPASFQQRYRKADHSPVGLSDSLDFFQKNFHVMASKKPVKVTNNLIFLGEIPRLNPYESQTTNFVLNDGTDDFVIDDSAMVTIVNNELVIITGCSHSGICNICDYAKYVTGISRIKAVIGGFHLKSINKQTRETITYFHHAGVEQIYPSHCTALPVLELFHKEFYSKQIKTGMILKF